MRCRIHLVQKIGLKLMLPSAVQQFQLEIASSLVSPRVDSHVCDPKDGPGYHLSIRGWGHHYRGCPGPKYANAFGSRRRMTPLSRSDRAQRFVLSRQRFVRWSQARATCQTASPQFLPSRAGCFHWSMIVGPDIRRGLRFAPMFRRVGGRRPIRSTATRFSPGPCRS